MSSPIDTILSIKLLPFQSIHKGPAQWSLVKCQIHLAPAQLQGLRHETFFSKGCIVSTVSWISSQLRCDPQSPLLRINLRFLAVNLKPFFAHCFHFFFLKIFASEIVRFDPLKVTLGYHRMVQLFFFSLPKISNRDFF